MRNTPTFLAIFFFITTLALLYVFVFKGKVAKTGKDGRVAIELTKENTDFALTEMRGFLESIQQINEGILTKGVEKIEKAAKKSGGSVIAHAPKGMMARLPLGFKKLGFSTHNLFDKIATDIKVTKDVDQAHQQLAILLHKCIACHRSYKVTVVSK